MQGLAHIWQALCHSAPALAGEHVYETHVCSVCLPSHLLPVCLACSGFHVCVFVRCHTVIVWLVVVLALSAVLVTNSSQYEFNII